VSKKVSGRGTSDSSPPTFEQRLSQLEAIVAELEEGELGLDAALQRFEQGIKLLKDCFQLLEQAEQRIALVTGISPQGEAETAPFDAAASEELARRGETHAHRRSSGR
jgi:exodeoxyribonuclease VII small subunit